MVYLDRKEVHLQRFITRVARARPPEPLRTGHTWARLDLDSVLIV